MWCVTHMMYDRLYKTWLHVAGKNILTDFQGKLSYKRLGTMSGVKRIPFKKNNKQVDDNVSTDERTLTHTHHSSGTRA